MSCVLLGDLLAFEYVAEMSTAGLAEYFCAVFVGINLSCNCIFDSIVEAWPSASRVEFTS
ncbi:hypothetical protein SCG7086_DP_00010 [Chlamydiales bacterium SCGC AG-110-P3]|nr:hypothetical protein SCG7086_DP_00010 [Chlamydiales bacterium SCGC AG-110-P3]